MVRDQLQPDLIHHLHAPAERRIVRIRKSKVHRVKDVAQEEDVDQNVRVVNARDGQDGVDHAPDKKDARVESLHEGGGANAQVDTANLFLHLFALQSVSVPVEQDCEVHWDEEKEEQGQDRDAGVDCFHITAKAE